MIDLILSYPDPDEDNISLESHLKRRKIKQDVEKLDSLKSTIDSFGHEVTVELKIELIKQKPSYTIKVSEDKIDSVESSSIITQIENFNDF